MAEIVIGVFPAPPHDPAVALRDPAVALLVERLESGLPDYELSVDTARAREVRRPRLPGPAADGGTIPLIVEVILPAATAAAVRAVIDITVSWLRGMGKADRGRRKTVDICGPDGALLATVDVSESGRRPRVRSFLRKDGRPRWRRWFRSRREP
jgi:hypothetical protein